MRELRTPRLAELSWTDSDEMSWLTTMAVVLTLGAVGLAIFGLPPADIHAPPHYLGIMDPLCGMTRALRALAVGDLGAAWRYNPGVFVLAAAVGFALMRTVVGLVTKRWLDVMFVRRRAVFLGIIVFVGGLWVNQQLHASLLMTS